VSYATVSRAINGRGRIAPATTERILHLVEELGYRPNANARSLHKAKGELVSMLLPALHYPQLNEIVDGVQEILSEAQLELLICPVGGRLERQGAYFEMLSSGRFEAVLLTHWSVVTPHIHELLVRGGRPYALIEQDLLDRGLEVVWEWLLAQGHLRIGLATGPGSLLETTLARQRCKQLGTDTGSFIDATTEPAEWQELLGGEREVISALICTDDATALTLRSLLPGTQITIVSLGSKFLAQLAGLPVLNFDGRQVGRAVAIRLLRMLNIPHNKMQEVEINFQVETTSLPR
jgi:DNA-binding LacI/PurR family transcriptional regulator